MTVRRGRARTRAARIVTGGGILVCLVAFTIVLLSGCGDEDGSAAERDSTAGYTTAVAEILDQYFADNARFQIDGGRDANPLAAAASEAAGRLEHLEPPRRARVEHRRLAAAFEELAAVYRSSSVLRSQDTQQTVQRQAINTVDAALGALEGRGFDVSQTTPYEKRMGELDDREQAASDTLQREVAAAKRAGSVARAAAAWRRYASAVRERAEHIAELAAPANVADIHARFVDGQRRLAYAYEAEAHAVAKGRGDPFLQHRAPDAVQALVDRRGRLQLRLTTKGYDTTGKT